MTNWEPGTWGLNPKASGTLSQSLRYLQPKDKCYNFNSLPKPGPLDARSEAELAWATHGVTCPVTKGLRLKPSHQHARTEGKGARPTPGGSGASASRAQSSEEAGQVQSLEHQPEELG